MTGLFAETGALRDVDKVEDIGAEDEEDEADEIVDFGFMFWISFFLTLHGQLLMNSLQNCL